MIFDMRKDPKSSFRPPTPLQTNMQYAIFPHSWSSVTLNIIGCTNQHGTDVSCPEYYAMNHTVYSVWCLKDNLLLQALPIPELKAVWMLDQALICSAHPFQDLQNTADKKTSEGRLMGSLGGKKELFASVALAPSLVSRSDALGGFASAASCRALLLGGCPRLSQPPGFLSALQGRLILVHRAHIFHIYAVDWTTNISLHTFPRAWIALFLWSFKNQLTSLWTKGQIEHICSNS